MATDKHQRTKDTTQADHLGAPAINRVLRPPIDAFTVTTKDGSTLDADRNTTEDAGEEKETGKDKDML